MSVQITKNKSFFYTCKENYFLGILPADPQSSETDGYKNVVEIAQTCFSAGLYEPIVQYLTESRYDLKLWSAYLTLEYGNPNNDLKYSCIEVIRNTVDQLSDELPNGHASFFNSFIQDKIPT